jgi:hypothetical protein
MSTSHIAAVTQALLSARNDQHPVDPTPLLAVLQHPQDAQAVQEQVQWYRFE